MLWRGRTNKVEQMSESAPAPPDDEHQSKQIVRAAMATARRAGWWVPGPLAVASVATAVALTWANSYYQSYYLAFGLTLRQVGLDRSEILFRLLPVGVVFTALIFMFAFLFQFFEVSTQPTSVPNVEKRSLLGRPGSLRDRTLAGTLTMVVVVIAVGSVLGVVAVNQWMKAEGKADAKRFVTSPYNAYFQGGWQTLFDTRSGASNLRWTGSPTSDPFKERTLEGKTGRQTMARIIVQNDGVTAYMDLFECNIHILPTNSVAVEYGLTDYATGDPAMTGLPPCRSTIQ